MPSQPIQMPFPLGGLTTNRGYETGEIQTTRGCLNVTPTSSEESRFRGGSRTGLTKRYESGVGERPTFAIRVSGGDNTRVYEYIVVGTNDNIFIGQSNSDGSDYPVTYSEVLSPLSGKLVTESGDNLVTELGDQIVLYEFNVSGSNTGVVANYRDVVVVGSDGESFGIYDNRSGVATYDSGSLELRIDDSAAIDWTTTGVDTSSFYVEVTNASQSPANIVSGTYRISSITASHLVVSGAPPVSGATSSPESISYSIKNAVRSLNPNTPSLDVIQPTGGFVPLGADDVISYRDRLVWAKNRTWYMSRQGDPGDYDYSANPEDPSRAIAGVSSGPGEPADPIIAMSTAGYDYLIMFSESAVWVMRGDPAYGGQLYQASSVAGCVSRNALCNGEGTEIYFLGKDGLYLMEPNAGAIRMLSKGKLPRLLRGVDRDNFDVSLVYEPEDHGVILFIVPKDGSSGTHYYFDVRTQSFWPFSLQDNSHQPVFAITFGGDPTRARRSCLAGYDGFIREWSGKSDDGQDIQSYVILGPYSVTSAEGVDGFLTELVSVIDEDSVPVLIEVYTGSSGEEAFSRAEDQSQSPVYSCTASAGRSAIKRPRARGGSFCVKISATGVWAFEGLSGMISAAGRNRRP